ncbi:hypothetical protein DL767_005600 [Monosporascus sp. MG133]|nr:hypothetical protein DL767_005600 [Monosporascus sp. MG133]
MYLADPHIDRHSDANGNGCSYTRPRPPPYEASEIARIARDTQARSAVQHLAPILANATQNRNLHTE